MNRPIIAHANFLFLQLGGFTPKWLLKQEILNTLQLQFSFHN